MAFPYIYIRCPCVDEAPPNTGEYRASEGGDEDEEQELTFDPTSMRANFSLYPVEHLQYCEDCQKIRCPKCILEEVACWYCPSCLFEIPSQMIKSEGSRCMRNCFECPICAAPMSVNTLDIESGAGLVGPWILACGYCNWTSLEIGMQFEKVTNIYSQIAKMKSGYLTIQPKLDPPPSDPNNGNPTHTPEGKFAALKAFYASQISSASTTAANPLLTPTGGFNYNSPSSLARIMNLYTNLGGPGKKITPKPQPMRESADPSEGLHVTESTADATIIQTLRQQSWLGTTSTTQRALQTHPVRFLSDLLPIPTLLRTKRNKRCRTCRHILVKPDAKVQSTRFKIKLIALSYIPAMVLSPLPSPSSSGTLSAPPSFPDLVPLRPIQFLFTLKNPLYDALRVTLATPARTPGQHAHKVTILCPQFNVGANTDLWDEALGTTDDNDARVRENRRLSQRTRDAARESVLKGGEGRVAEAGKVWDMGRNWTAVVLEVVCAEVKGEREDLEEDEDVLEIPIFVRVEWEAGDGGGGGGVGMEKSEKKELAYWVVVGVGRIVGFED